MHMFSYPSVTPITPAAPEAPPPLTPAAPAAPSVPDRRAEAAARQRELVRASLLRCPPPAQA